ncbi:MAG: hypothetical protein L0I79_03755, partial [Atopostipes sp.]|nr:hypothetical protein [Atopostipes sp.]
SNIFISNLELRKRFKKENSRIGIQSPNVLGLKATEAAYKNGDHWFEKLMILLNKNVYLTIKILKEIDNRFKVMRPEASFLVCVNIEEFGKSNQEFMEILESNKIFVTNGERYGKEGKGWIRINIGMPTEYLEANLKRFSLLDL